MLIIIRNVAWTCSSTLPRKTNSSSHFSSYTPDSFFCLNWLIRIKVEIKGRVLSRICEKLLSTLFIWVFLFKWNGVVEYRVSLHTVYIHVRNLQNSLASNMNWRNLKLSWRCSEVFRDAQVWRTLKFHEPELQSLN